MSGYEIGISGFQAAQKALSVVGNNLANAATEGYHRQKVDLRAKDDAYSGGILIGQGVEVDGIVRMVNTLLDEQIVNQESLMSQVSRELESLKTLESAFGELSTDALSTAIDKFFGAMHDLTAHPTDPNYQNPVISAAEAMSNQLRNLGTTVAKIQDGVYSEAQDAIGNVNVISAQIAELNKSIHARTVGGQDANNMMDQRDQLITEMARLVGVTTYQREFGVIDVAIGDTGVVVGSNSLDLKVGLILQDNVFKLGISPDSVSLYSTNISGGRLGGLMSLRNDALQQTSDSLDTFAKTIANEINKVHSQGVGSAGSFTILTGWTMTETNLSDFEPSVADGETIYVRVTDAGGTVRRYGIAVDASAGGDTLTSIAAKFAAIAGLSGSTVDSRKLKLVADAGFSFDFLPGVLASPVNSTLTGTVPAINISGNYTGSGNNSYTCTVTGTGTVGAGTLTIDVDDGSGTVATLNVGSGYVPGSVINVIDGIKISIGAGDLNNTEDFEISAIADTDASGLLASTGMNAFFSGTTARSIAVTDYVSNLADGVSHIAVSRSVTMDDSRNMLAMANLGDTTISGFGSLTPKAYYRGIATDIANRISTTKTRRDNVYGVWQSLSRQRDEISGVDMNDEAAKMLVFERMFQGMAKYMNAVSKSLESLMSIMR